MSVGNNIRHIRQTHDLTQEEFGKIADVSSMAVSQWENERAVPRMGAIQRIADYFGIPKSYIIDGAETRERKLPKGAIIPTPSAPAYAPLFGRVHAGHATEPEVLDAKVPLPREVADNHPNAYFLEVEGDCMDKVYPEGCYILVDPDVTPTDGSIAAVSIDGLDCVMRRLRRGASSLMLIPESFNPVHEDIVISLSDDHTVELIGTVVWFQSAEEME